MRFATLVLGCAPPWLIRLIPWRRQSSAVFAPAADSLIMPTIWASVNRDLRIWAAPLRPVPREFALLPYEHGTWIFRLSVAGLKAGDGVVVEDCEISDVNAEWPTILAPRVPWSEERYAYIFPESAQRIASTIRERFGSPPRPFGEDPAA